MDPMTRAELLALFPDLSGAPGDAARNMLKSWEAWALAD
jgi:hypothetical protein